MPILALAAAGALLVASPTWVPVANTAAPNVKTPEPTWYAEQGGVLLGNALRCGIATPRIFKARELVEAAIRASSRDKHDGEVSTARFTQFFMASAAPRFNDTNLAPCKQVVGEFEHFERHYDAFKRGEQAAVGDTSSPAYRPSEGE